MTDHRRAIAAKLSLRTLSRGALCCLLGATLLAAASPARAGDDDSESVPLDTKIFRSLMDQLGLERGDARGITYEERAPLVIPPNHDLPPPEKTDAALSNNPAWPVDPDVQRRKQEVAQRREAKANGNADETLRKEWGPLPPDQLAPGPKPRNTRRTADDSYRSPNGSSDQFDPSTRGPKPATFFGKLFGKDEPDVGSFTGEPPRTALTDPPPGYQTPSPEQPYGVGKDRTKPKATNFLESHGDVSGGNTN
jgi:hypothetical protein